ncbi:MAG TPA: nucleoside triphosphate hydrolase [Phycisphaerae bacterium]|nr:nucleoside triphosphate hydrolase [Phycisphaerae bacterium]
MIKPPEAWLKRLPELLTPVTLEVAGYGVPVPFAAEELRGVYLPLMAFMEQLSREKRVLAGLAGIPGSGKSTFAAIMRHLADRLFGPGFCVAVGIDGWHWPNAVLNERTTLDEAGRVIPLRQRKGGPESFDVAGLVDTLQHLQHAAAAVTLPAYDRRLHEPVPNALTIAPEARIVLVEGNYLLSDQPPWNAVSALLSPKCLLGCDPAEARRRVIDRHIRGGCTAEEAEHKCEHNDRLNAQIVMGQSDRADWIIELEPIPSVRTP